MEILYNNFFESDISLKLVRLIKMCFNETHSKSYIGAFSKNTSIMEEAKAFDQVPYVLMCL